jgi:hypothetical protein
VKNEKGEEVGVPQFDVRDALSLAIRLALGKPRLEDCSANWPLVFDAASRELLAPLAWLRSGQFIRRFAGPVVTDRWRRAAVATHVRGQQQLDLLRAATEALEAAGVEAVVLKGVPLGDRLYGDPFVRCSADIDLHVPASQRARASVVLGALGWRIDDGQAPWHQTWSIWRSDVAYYLEVHSSLVSDHLTHLAAPAPGAVTACVAGVPVRVLAGDFMAPYLAVHLATHQMPPLLWLVDFATLWAGLPPIDRVRAEAAARRAGVAKYLIWARERGELVHRLAMGDPEALGNLGVAADRRHDVHSIWRHLSLAASTADRARVVAAFLIPRRVRGDLRALAQYTVARLRTRLLSLAGASRAYLPQEAPAANSDARGTFSAARPLRLERDDMVVLATDIVRAGGALRVRARGGSMLPTIPRGALVRIGAVPPAGVTRGDVVLALTSDGEPVLHRAIAVRPDAIVTRGDAAIHVDPAVPLGRIIGIATHVGDGVAERALGRRPQRSIAISALKLRRRIARVVHRDR